jgi:Ti-type conjugative transfer relaxase TraA
MLSISPPMKGAGRGDYYLELAKEDYYTKGGEPPGTWQGEGAKLLGLKGQVKEKNLRKILDGFNPKRGKKLVQNAGEKDRQSGWDLTFSAPKSVSTIWAVADEETRRKIQEAQRKAVSHALNYLQDEAAFTRRGKTGVFIEEAKLVFATFEHGTSRAQDPQLHTHALLMNLGVRKDGTTGTVLSKPIFEQKMAAGAIYRVELAYQLSKELNLEAEREKSWFRITGSSKELEDEFSKRRKEIEKVLNEKGYSGSVASQVAALDTRSTKENISRESLFKEWQKVGQEFGFAKEDITTLTEKNLEKRTLSKINLKDLLNETLSLTTNKISDKESYFSKTSFIRHAAEEAQCKKISSKELIDGALNYLNNSTEIIYLGKKEGKKFYTTKEILELESQIISTARSRQSESLIVSNASLISALKQELDSEQKEAVIRITQKVGATQIVTGFAGTGKSFMLEAARKAFEEDGIKVFGAAPSGVAAEGLQNATGIKSSTIHRTLKEIESGELQLDKKSVLIVDEAGMVGTKLMARLFEETNRTGSKLILVGDQRQIQSVQAGGALKALKEELGYANLTVIRRQREEWAKEAVIAFADGKADKALREYNKRGLVNVSDNGDKARESLIREWKKEGIEKPADNIIIATTNLDVTILNEKAQAVRFLSEKLRGDALTLNGKTYFEGDRILLTRNSKEFEVRNGNLGNILEIDHRTKVIKVELDSNKVISLNLNKYEHISLGYAVTAHKSQGATYERAHLFISNHDHKEIAYVKASRVKGNAYFYMDKETAGENLSTVSKQLQKSQIKELAHSLAAKISKEQRI